MAKNVFNPETNYSIKLLGHVIQPNSYPLDVHGYFEADTVEFDDEPGKEREFAVFHVDEPNNGEYPREQVGVYRISMGNIKQGFPWILNDVQPEPEPEADPADPEADPDGDPVE